MSEPRLSIKGTRVLVVGDIMLDRYYWGSVSRISPEAPVPVVKIEKTTQTLGGAGNVAHNLACLGSDVTVIGLCGDDAASDSIARLLAAKGIGDGLIRDPARPTITKTRILAQKQQMMRLDEETLGALDGRIVHQVGDAVFQALDQVQAVILSDYGKGVFTDSGLAQKIIHMARQRGLAVLVDPKGTSWERYERATCITPNKKEFCAVAGEMAEKDDARLVVLARDVRSRLRLDWLLITLGADGMCLVGPRGEVVMIPARAREVFDVSGAGDTVIATLAAAIAGGLPFPQAARTANLAAGIVVGKLGTQPILASELDAALQYTSHRRIHPDLTSKIMALDAALPAIEQWREKGDKIVFTNGCFDLLHPGHISLLHQSRRLGDRLIVGLNTDASVRRLKGPERPILSEQDRAAILSALGCVDMVIHFDEDTPLALIRTIKPDILVKGSDYTPQQVVGKAVVESYGGRVELVALVQGYSTTGIARKVLEGRPK